MHKYIILVICLFLLISCSKESKSSENIDQIILENDIKCNLILQVLNLNESNDKLLFCDESNKVRVSYIKNIDNAWILQRSEAIDKDENRTLAWSVKGFRDLEYTVKYPIAWGIVWNKDVSYIEINDTKHLYQAEIIEFNQEYRLWYYLFTKDNELGLDLPNVQSIIGYDKNKKVITSIP